MSQNDGVIALFTERVTREVDLGELLPAKRGVMVPVYVNAPGILTHWFGGRADGVQMRAADERERTCQVVAAFYGWSLDKVQLMEDSFLNWFFNQGMRLRREYLESLKNA